MDPNEYAAKVGGNVNPNPPAPSQSLPATVGNIQLPNETQGQAVDPSSIAPSLLRGYGQQNQPRYTPIQLQGGLGNMLNLKTRQQNTVPGLEGLQDVAPTTNAQVNVKQPVTVPPEQQYLPEAVTPPVPNLPASFNQQEYANPFQSFRQNVQQLVTKFSGFEGGDEYMKEIFQGQDPQVFFNNLANTFGASWEHLGNKTSALSSMYKRGQGDK